MNSYTIEDFRFELEVLQLQDTKNAKELGFQTKTDWYNYIINQPVDEIAEAIIDLAERENISAHIIAKYFDKNNESMIMRVDRLLNQKQESTISKAA